MGTAREADLTDPKKLAAALMDNKPRMDLVGPTVDDDIRRAISRYGADAVKEAVKIQTKPRRGRKPEKDWPELNEILKADARDWLAGGDPFSTRSNYAIAKKFADNNPGHSHPATMKRIERKLVQKRVWMTLAFAERFSREGYPHGVYIRAVEALTAVDPAWTFFRDNAKSNIVDYEAKKGEPPPAELSITEIEAATRNELLTLGTLNPPKKSLGLFGLAARYAPKTDGQG